VRAGGQPNFKQLMQLQQQLAAAQAELAAAEVTGTAGGGLVTVTAAGSGEVRSVRIDPAVDRMTGDARGPSRGGAMRPRAAGTAEERSDPLTGPGCPVWVPRARSGPDRSGRLRGVGPKRPSGSRSTCSSWTSRTRCGWPGPSPRSRTRCRSAGPASTWPRASSAASAPTRRSEARASRQGVVASSDR
jgi:hypothetical protein